MSSKVLRSRGVNLGGVSMVQSAGGGCEFGVVPCFELVRPILFSSSWNYVVIRVYICVRVPSLVLLVVLLVVNRATSLSDLVTRVAEYGFLERASSRNSFFAWLALAPGRDRVMKSRTLQYLHRIEWHRQQCPYPSVETLLRLRLGCIVT